MATDRRGRLDDDVFRCREAKGGRVIISWAGHTIRTLNGKEAITFLAKAERADAKQLQLLLAKATGNFKRGNE